MEKENKRNWKRKTALIILGVFLSFCVLASAAARLTYIEYEDLNDQSDTYVSVFKDTDEIVQEFTAPYDLLYGIGVKVNTFARDNNSIWSISIWEPSGQKKIFEKIFNASQAQDYSYYIAKLNRNISLKSGKKYELRISSINANENTAIGFYCSNTSVIKDSRLYVNGMETDGDLCLRVYGGNYDYWWAGFAAFCIFVVFFVVLRYKQIRGRSQRLRDDKILCSMLLAVVVFLLLCTYSATGSFGDEDDNMIGGMIIAKGGVLYKDYITQHMPAAYYLCAVFARLGAGSVQQFRLLYYILQAFVWGFLYFRHSGSFGRKRMAALPIIEIVLLLTIVPTEGHMILADHLQGLCLAALLLEFLSYYRQRKLGWDRAAVVSLCIWGSFGAAFISIYALFCIFLAAAFVEVSEWVNVGFTLKKAMERYMKLSVAVGIPFVGAVLYFWYNNALRHAYRQAFLFNTQVYPLYLGGLGAKIFQPFFDGLQNFLGRFAGSVNSLLTGNIGNAEVIQFLILAGVLCVIVKRLLEKDYFTAAVFFAYICCNAIRGFGFHGMPGWYVLIIIFVLYASQMINYNSVVIVIAGCIGVFLLSDYVNNVSKNLADTEQNMVSEFDHKIIEMTKEDEGVFLDKCAYDSIYILYKNRYPVNRLVYFMPWYLDWFEEWAIEDLTAYMPGVVLYNEEVVVWDQYAHYADAFVRVLKEYYTQYVSEPDHGWKNYLWLRKKST